MIRLRIGNIGEFDFEPSSFVCHGVSWLIYLYHYNVNLAYPMVFNIELYDKFIKLSNK